MKLTAILLTIACLNAGAATTGQTVTLHERNAPLEKIFKAITRQTGYVFFYADGLLDKNNKVSVAVKDAPLDQALRTCLEGQPLTWTIVDKTIVLKERLAPITPVAPPPPLPQLITGKVTNSNAEPLSGASVTEKGTSNNTMTKNDGTFSIDVSKANATLVVSYIGFQTRELRIGKQTNLSISLDSARTSLDEVVIIGYGAVRKKDLTGSVVSLKGEELKEVPTTNVLEAAQGKIAGADIVRSSGQAGSGVSITIRGVRSVASGTQPLIIVDGIQYQRIEDINPNDIQSMEVLKDASSTAIYGSRAANGVVIITTKKGASGKTDVSFNSYVGVSEATMYPKAMNFDEFTNMRREAYRAAGLWNSTADDPVAFAGNGELKAVQNRTWTDYQEELLHKGLQQDYQLGIRGGSDKLKAYMSLDYFNEKGLLKLDDLKRYSGRLNLDFTVNKFMTIGMQSQYTYYNQSVRRDPLNQANKVSPLGALYDSLGNFNFLLIDGQTGSPLADEQPGVYKNSVQTTRVLANAYVEIKPMTGLTFRSTFGANTANTRQGIYASPKSLDRGLQGKSQSQYLTSMSRNLNWENVLTYIKNTGNHNLSVTAIGSYVGFQSEDASATGVNQLLPSQLFYALENNSEEIKISSDYLKSDLVSFAGRINYGFMNKYLLTLTGRADGSSKLAVGNKWTFFPSAAFAWRAIDESFLQKQNVLSDLKLRVSYGVAGNDPGNSYIYSTQSQLTRMAFGWDNTPAQAYTYSRQVGNTSLGWELTTTKNLGLDFGILNNRITGAVDVYEATTKDLLLPRGLPPTTGVTTVVQNIGKTRNRGVEVSLSTVNIESRDFSWTSNFTFTHNKEEFVELVTGKDDIGNGWFLGQPINVYYDYEKIGIWQTKDATDAAKYNQKPGEIRIKDQNNDGKIETQNDRIILGTPRPKWSGGFDNTVKYKGFDLNVFFFARIGQMINADRYGRFDAQGLGNSTTGLNYWTPENPSNDYPRPNKNGNLLYLSTLPYRNGSYVRLRNISLGYNVPGALLKGSFVSSIRAYVTAKNLFTWTKDNIEYDPERGGSENFPMTKLFVFGLNVNF
ncbi:TonB-dependent receptor [Paraflavitalea pollutisoli]|uniref:TonB-dependent receptor n=1 Tax=Paraflavitalea pollutisoli TaxID=3034143 RepID=UPI0023EB2383|nr:TonB-dependent receptor [Paraflavitalea sp. H1-2-19X]